MPTTAPTVVDYRVTPYRFTDRPHEMTTFLAAVGLRVTRSKGGWAELVGAGGSVGVHPLNTAEFVTTTSTAICLETDDATVAVETLRAAGIDARWWDESYGRQAAATGPYGEITVSEAMADLSGDDSHRAVDRPDVHVIAVYFTPDFEAGAAFFARFGFTGDETLSGWRPLRGRPAAGAIGLHAADDAPDPGDRCALSFEIGEPLDAFAVRLRGLGYEVTDDRDADAPHVTVTDPDGERIEVHAR